MHLIDHFDRAAALASQRCCVRCGEHTLSFEEVSRLTWRIASELKRRGVDRGARVAIYASNSVALYVHILGLFRLGAVWVHVNPLNGAPENADILTLVEADAVLFTSQWAAHIETIKSRAPGDLKLLMMDEGFRWLGPAAELEDRDCVIGPDRDPGAVVSILCTGGTTGRPKGVPFTNLMWEALIATFHISIPVHETPVCLAAVPLSHGAGVVALCLLASAATQVILPKFDAESVLAAIERDRVTHMFLPPTAIYMLLSAPSVRRRDLSSMRCLLYAGAPMSEERLREALEVFGPVMTQTYGQAEAPLICTVLCPVEHVEALDRAPHRLRSCGRPTMFTEVSLLDDDGQVVEPGTEGEICVRGNLAMTGYLQDQNIANVPRAANAWHRTGDVGRFDEDGYLYIVDRKKDMIISGGFNVYPSAIERVLFMHVAVQDCAVIGVPDAKWGEAVKAIVELKCDQPASADELLDLCRRELGPVCTPKTVEFWTELPRSPVGKVLKSAIRERFWKDAGRRI
ncbi:MAG: class I adenylate-forming enzyme family protein [Steroidobacteraceae bacterium]